MLDQLKIMVGVAAVTFALTASLTAAMTNNSPDTRGGSPTATPAAAVTETPGPVDTPDADGPQSDGEDAAIVSEGEGQGQGGGCVEALTERAQSRTQLEGHTADESFPAGGVNGNQNALDHQCGGAFAETATEGVAAPTPEAAAPGNSGQAPGHSGEDHGNGQGQSKP